MTVFHMKYNFKTINFSLTTYHIKVRNYSKPFKKKHSIRKSSKVQQQKYIPVWIQINTFIKSFAAYFLLYFLKEEITGSENCKILVCNL